MERNVGEVTICSCLRGDHALPVILFVMRVHSYSCVTVDVAMLYQSDHSITRPTPCDAGQSLVLDLSNCTVGRRLTGHADAIHEATWSSIGTTLNSYGD
jgi:hypothetical protein